MSSRIWLIVGPPGTGKTTELSRQARRAAAAHGGSSVAIVSLTKTAAAEIGSRDTDVPEENCATLHAHAYRALDRPQLAETPEGIRAFNAAHPDHELSGSGGDQLEDTIDADASAGTLGDQVHNRVMNHRARRTPIEQWTADERDHHALWADFKAQTGRMDFTDLIETCLRDVDAHPAAPRVLLLDEAQDFSRLELDLAVKWAARTDTTVVAGDSLQALYSWRGSDAGALEQLPLAGERVLSRSHRVPAAVHALAVGWARQHTGADRLLRDYQPTDSAGQVARHHATLRHPEALLDDVRADLADGRSVMLLTTCGYMLTPLLQVLRRHGIPFHNPLRPKQGAWNPMRAAGRLAAFLRPRDDVWGKQARAWTWDDIRQWTEPLQARGILARGAKELIKSKCQPDQFGISQSHHEVPLEGVLDLLNTRDLHHPALALDVDWWHQRLLASKRKAQDFPIQVLRQAGPAALRATPKVITGTIHCSPPDELIATRRGDVPIAELEPDDRLVGWHRGTNSVLGDRPLYGGYEFQRSERPYQGQLVVIETERSRTRVTPNHRVVVRFDDDAFCERWAVYLMRKDSWWRVGICTTAHRPYRAGGLGGRLSTEQADEGWILGVYEERREALIAEATIQARYGLPGLTFRAAAARSLNNGDLAAIHDAVAPYVQPRAHRLLKDLGLSADWPLYTRAPLAGEVLKRNMRGNFVTEAANLVPLSGRVQMLTTPAIDRKAAPMRATVTTEPYVGTVYGLDVPPHHHYVSGNAIVHNSVKGGEASSVYIWPDLSRAGMWTGWHPGGPGRDQIIRMLYVALTRAREKVTVLDPVGPEHVPLDLLTPDHDLAEAA